MARSAGDAKGRILPRRFYARDAREVAPELLNKVLVHGHRSGRIVEVEAYVGDGTDPGSHAHRGRTPRNATMFGPPGHLYVYFSYGMHWCANAVCDPEGTASAVLIRALAPLGGIEDMRAARAAARTDRDLANGPGKLCQALGLTGHHDGADLVDRATGITILDDRVPPPTTPAVTPRIGLSAGTDHPWRWSVSGDPNVSRRVAAPATFILPGESRGGNIRRLGGTGSAV